MKQRLGLAAVLMKDPELLVLDEPANGLDPSGIKEFRELMRSLGDEGRTVFVSSHLLSEVEAVCDNVAILARGRLLAEGNVADVLSASRAHAFIVRTPKLREARRLLADAGFTVVPGGDRTLQVTALPRRAGTITRTLAEHGIYLTELRPTEVSLEDVFLRLTEETKP
jgi:ABC-2 type transport system ATP-binding protein